MSRNGRKASAFMAMRSELLTALQVIDAEIDRALSHSNSQRAADRARLLFQQRARICDELLDYGIEVDPHPAVERL